MESTAIGSLRDRIEGYAEEGIWEMLSIHPDAENPDIWHLTVKDHRAKDDRRKWADEQQEEENDSNE